MPNTYFQFKQFTVHQEKTAMKVCTDACLFGAWVADKLTTGEINAEKILDIGAGTGLLSLMLAQQTPARIDAIEIDADAAEQANHNFEASVWKDRLQLIKTDVRLQDSDAQYGLIISNPPFFDNDLKSPDQQRNLALHSSELTLEELIQAVTLRLAPDGKFAVLLPYHRTHAFTEMALKEGFFVEENVSVRQTPTHTFFRSMLLLGRKNDATNTREIIIRSGNHYTPGFIELLKAYYLAL